jgi:hypothetical protein
MERACMLARYGGVAMVCTIQPRMHPEHTVKILSNPQIFYEILNVVDLHTLVHCDIQN